MTQVKGIDVSRHQGVIDWAKVSASGVHFVAMRCTLGTHGVDDKFFVNWQGAKDAGLLVTAYHLVFPDLPPQEQVAHFLATMGYRVPDMPLVLDCEMPQGQNKQTVTANIQAQVNLLPPVNGLKPLIYTNQAFGNTYMLSNFGCPLWVANYTTADEPRMPVWWDTWKLWQYSSTGHTPGIAGNVDQNRYNGTLREFRQWLGLANEPTWAQQITTWARGLGYTGVDPDEE